jgi:hypothetical protein
VAWQNILLLFLSLLASVAATVYVARHKLVHTPGDLIYNRIVDTKTKKI